MNPLKIRYQSESFPLGSIANEFNDLKVTWDDVLWSAVTVGRPNRNYVFRNGVASIYEAIFRLSLIRMALEQSGPAAYRLRSTDAAKTLDPTEKGAVNYFLGMTFCKLFANKLLNTPWLLHLDVFRPKLNPVLTGRSRPDMVGKEHSTGRWHAFECKGRASPPGKTVKEKAKNQAQRLVSLNGVACSLHIGAITHLKNDVLQFYWRDPVPEQQQPIDVSVPTDVWRYYYEPVTQLVAGNQDSQRLTLGASEGFLSIADLDIQVGIHRLVAGPLFHGQWNEAHEMALQNTQAIAQDGYQRDGLVVKAGNSWRRRFEDTNL